jgi:hypothetical protein
MYSPPPDTIRVTADKWFAALDWCREEVKARCLIFYGGWTDPNDSVFDECNRLQRIGEDGVGRWLNVKFELEADFIKFMLRWG